MWRYFDLLSFLDSAEIALLKVSVATGLNPRDVKVMLGQELVARFHSRTAADEALAEFEARFRQGVLPDDMPELTLQTGEPVSLVQVLKQSGLTASTSEALRMIEQGAVRANGDKVSDRSLTITVGEKVILQVGKRKFAKVTLV